MEKRLYEEIIKTLMVLALPGEAQLRIEGRRFEFATMSELNEFEEKVKTARRVSFNGKRIIVSSSPVMNSNQEYYLLVNYSPFGAHFLSRYLIENYKSILKSEKKFVKYLNQAESTLKDDGVEFWRFRRKDAEEIDKEYRNNRVLKR